MEKLLLKVFRMIINAVSPELRELLFKYYEQLKAKAAQTPNEWDDVFVGLLGVLLGLEGGP